MQLFAFVGSCDQPVRTQAVMCTLCLADHGKAERTLCLADHGKAEQLARGSLHVYLKLCFKTVASSCGVFLPTVQVPIACQLRLYRQPTRRSRKVKRCQVPVELVLHKIFDSTCTHCRYRCSNFCFYSVFCEHRVPESTIKKFQDIYHVELERKKHKVLGSHEKTMSHTHLRLKSICRKVEILKISTTEYKSS